MLFTTICVMFMLCSDCILAGSVSRQMTESDHGYFWQITDIHYDANFSTGGDITDMCHKKGLGSVLSEYGDYNCDSPWLLVQSVVTFMKMHPEKIDFILWTGDTIPHISDDNHDTDKVNEVVHNVTEHITSNFPKVPIFPSIGNHDAWPAHQVPFNTTTVVQYYKDALSKWNWDKLLDNTSTTQFEYGGFYRYTLPATNLSIINLNSALWYFHNKYPLESSGHMDPDPANQFQWLHLQLQMARNESRKVLIISHIPPGYYCRLYNKTWFYHEYNKRLVDLVSPFGDVIVGGIFGHEHTDAFRVITGPQGPIAIHMSPSVTPLRTDTANNPSVRLYKYNTKTYQLLDYTQFYLNLTHPETGWTEEYTLTKEFHIPSASGDALLKLVALLDANRSQLIKFVHFNSVSYNLSEVCDIECQTWYLCSYTHVTADDYLTCVDRLTPSVIRHYYWVVSGGIAILLVLTAIIIICQRRRVSERMGKYSSVRQEVAEQGLLSFDDED